MPSVLVVEDDDTIGDVVASSLRSHGYEVELARSGGAAVAAVDAAHGPGVDLVLLELGLPDLDGVEVCRRLRQRLPGAVIVMLTARRAEMDVVVGLDAGADDYLTKPVRLHELLARIRAHLRRAGPPAAPSVVQLGDLSLDVGGRRVLVQGRELALRSKEFDLLARLAREPDTAVSRETLMADVWDEHWHGPTRTLDVHVASLRRRIASCGEARVPRITTLRGHGYRLEHPDRAVPEG